MRVGLLIYGNLDTLSGGYLYDRKLVRYLQDHGDDVEIISLPWRNYAAHLGDNLSATLLRRLAGSRFDVLIQDELNHPSLFLLNRRLRDRISCPIISIVHHLRSSEKRRDWQNCLYRLPERAYLQSVDGFIFNSQTTRNVVEETIGKSRPHVVAYPAGNRLEPQIDQAEISARAREKDPLKIVFLGSVIPRKNLHTLLDALSQLTPGSYQLSVIGGLDVDRDYAQRIRRQVADLGLERRVTFFGAMHDKNLRAALQENHILLMPSSYEGFGIAYLEGMGFALPAIASKEGAAHEIITHNVDGFLIEAENASSLAGHLRELTSNREKLIQMSLAARKRYLAHPTWDQSMANIREFLWKITQTLSAT